MPHSQHSFPSSLPIIQRIKPDAKLDPSTPTKYLDERLAILGDSLVTKHEFVESQGLQDKGIRREFEQQRNYTDERFEEQRTYMDERFEEQRSYMDERFKHTDERFADVDRQFEEMRARQFNSMCTRAHDPLHAIAKIKRSTGSTYVFQMPKHFPKNVGKFWRLKSPDCVEKLTYLVQFYEVKGYEDWENDDNAYDRDDLGLTSGSSSIGGSSELDDTSLGTSTLENAVRRHPDKALRALAMKLGLVYRDVTRCMEEIEHRQFLQDIVAAKRRSPQQDSGRQAKIARRTAAYSPPQHSSSFLRHLVMTASQEMRERMEKSKGSESERVYWEEPDAIDGQTRLLAALARGDVSLQVVENRSGSGRSAPKHLAGEQSAAEEPTVEEPIAVPWEDGSTVPITVSSRKLSEKRSSQASERKGRVTPAKSSGTGRSSASEE